MVRIAILAVAGVGLAGLAFAANNTYPIWPDGKVPLYKDVGPEVVKPTTDDIVRFTNVSTPTITFVKVDAEEKKIGAGSFTTDWEEQEGPSGTKFTYTATLANNSGEKQTYSLAAEGAPEGWSVAFTPSGASSATSSVPVEAGKSTTITVAVTPSPAYSVTSLTREMSKSFPATLRRLWLIG